MPTSLADIFGEVIYAYTRANAIADGVLIPVPELDAMLAGIVLPLAVHSSVWRASRADDLPFRLAMLRQCYLAIKSVLAGEDRAYFKLSVPEGKPLAVVIHCGPGDDAEPVLTVCEPSDL